MYRSAKRGKNGGGGEGCEGCSRKNRKFRRVVEIRGAAWRGGRGGEKGLGCLLVRVRWSRGIHRRIRGRMTRGREGCACRGDASRE